MHPQELTGKIPSELGMLSMMERLSVDYNVSVVLADEICKVVE
jgi:hypothetical protein